MIGMVLSVIGYTAGVDQSAETLQGIRATAFLIPAVASALSALIILFYPLDMQLHSRIVRALEHREKAARRKYRIPSLP